jgi:hypothetical protein
MQPSISKKKKNNLYRTSMTSSSPENIDFEKNFNETSSYCKTSSLLDFQSKKTGNIMMKDLAESLCLILITEHDQIVQDIVSEYNINVFFDFYNKAIENINI